jgi:hypothetical protein
MDGLLTAQVATYQAKTGGNIRANIDRLRTRSMCRPSGGRLLPCRRRLRHGHVPGLYGRAGNLAWCGLRLRAESVLRDAGGEDNLGKDQEYVSVAGSDLTTPPSGAIKEALQAVCDTRDSPCSARSCPRPTRSSCLLPPCRTCVQSAAPGAIIEARISVLPGGGGDPSGLAPSAAW